MSQLPLPAGDDQERELRELFIALGAPAARHASAFASTEEITLTWELIELFTKAGGDSVRREDMASPALGQFGGPPHMLRGSGATLAGKGPAPGSRKPCCGVATAPSRSTSPSVSPSAGLSADDPRLEREPGSPLGPTAPTARSALRERRCRRRFRRAPGRATAQHTRRGPPGTRRGLAVTSHRTSFIGPDPMPAFT